MAPARVLKVLTQLASISKAVGAYRTIDFNVLNRRGQLLLEGLRIDDALPQYQRDAVRAGGSRQ